MNFKSLSQTDLFTQTQTAIKEERLSTLRVLHLFREIERRRDFGNHSSLYELATKEFAYSAAAAHRRIQAMRLLRSMPDYESKIENGELSLTAAASAQSYFQRAKTKKPEKTEVLNACLNKSSRDVEKTIAGLEPQADKRTDLRYSTRERIRMSLNISEETYVKLEKLKFAYRCQTIEQLIDLMADQMPLDQPPQEKKKDSLPAPEVRTRHIPSVTKRIVLKNCEPKCSYKDPATGQECGQTKNLEYDHIHPYSAGGPHLVENLRLLCAPHNKYVWNKEQKII